MKMIDAATECSPRMIKMASTDASMTWDAMIRHVYHTRHTCNAIGTFVATCLERTWLPLEHIVN